MPRCTRTCIIVNEMQVMRFFWLACKNTLSAKSVIIMQGSNASGPIAHFDFPDKKVSGHFSRSNLGHHGHNFWGLTTLEWGEKKDFFCHFSIIIACLPQSDAIGGLMVMCISEMGKKWPRSESGEKLHYTFPRTDFSRFLSSHCHVALEMKARQNNIKVSYRYSIMLATYLRKFSDGSHPWKWKSSLILEIWLRFELQNGDEKRTRFKPHNRTPFPSPLLLYCPQWFVETCL